MESKIIYKFEDSIIRSKLTKGLICREELSDYRYNILKYENENILVKNLNLNFEALECKKVTQNGFNGIEITPFDQIHLGYYLDGSNHIALGIGSKNLYYYRYILNKDTIFFKDSYPYIETFATPKGRILFKNGKNEIYELIKKQ